MFTKFASGYYVGSYWVLDDVSEWRMNKQEYERVREDIYNGQTPLVMRLGTVHFRVSGDESVPEKTLYAPITAVESSSIGTVPEKTPVFLAKPEHAERLVNTILA